MNAELDILINIEKLFINVRELLGDIKKGLEINNKLMYMALNMETTNPNIICPSCKSPVIPDGLGYCPKCKNDLSAIGLAELPGEKE